MKSKEELEKLEIKFCLKRNITEIPKCVICGKRVRFNGSRFTKTCSKKCENIERTRTRKNDIIGWSK